MHRRVLGYLAILIVTGFCATTAQALRPKDGRDTITAGHRIYDRACAWCHGSEGKGDGPSGWSIGRYAAPRPRDFTAESYKLRSTPSGELPTDQDLFRTITQGIPGFMPSYRSLNEQERWQVITYLKSLNPAFEQEQPTSIALPAPPPPPSGNGITIGRALYAKYECQTCHGDNGTGDGPESKAGHLRDANNLPITPTDLTDPTSFKNGATPHDLYRSIMTGLDGTPMPAYANQFAGQEEAAWDLVWYLQSLSGQPGR